MTRAAKALLKGAADRASRRRAEKREERRADWLAGAGYVPHADIAEMNDEVADHVKPRMPDFDVVGEE